jgi:dipicolinate synthase subunit B
MIGYAICGSFCTHKSSLAVLKALVGQGMDIQPIMSQCAYTTDTRFGSARELRQRVEELCQREIIHTIEGAEPLGPKLPLDALIIAPCTGNTLSKLASGITDTPVTMAAKAHLRCDRPTLIALATNDALSQNLGNIARLLTRRSVYFVPMRQDDPVGKPHSLVADFELIPKALENALQGKDTRPLFL